MPSHSRCPKCEKSFQVSPESVGRNARCNACQSVFVIGKLDEIPPPLGPEKASSEKANSEKVGPEKVRSQNRPEKLDRNKRSEPENLAGDTAKRKPATAEQSGKSDKRSLPVGLLIGVVACGLLFALLGYGFLNWRSAPVMPSGVTAKVADFTQPDGVATNSLDPNQQGTAATIEPGTTATIEDPDPKNLANSIGKANPPPAESSLSGKIDSRINKRAKTNELIIDLHTINQAAADSSAAVEEEKKRFDEARLDHSFRTDTEILLLLTLQEKHGRIEKQREEQKNGHEVTFERYSPEEIELGAKCSSIACRTIKAQIQRDLGITPKPSFVEQSADEFRHGLELKAFPQAAKQVKVVYPAPRPFDHPYRVIHRREPKDGCVFYYVAAKLDIEPFFLFASTVSDNETSTPNDTIRLGIVFYQQQDRIKDVDHFLIRVDGQLLNCPRHSEREHAVSTELRLDQFQDVIKGTAVALHIGPFTIELEPKELEALRDFASRLPQGRSLLDQFVISREVDVSSPPRPQPRPADYRQVLNMELAMGLARIRLRAELKRRIDRITETRLALKQAVIQDDQAARDEAIQSLEEDQEFLIKWIDHPFGSLDLTQFQMGQIGKLDAFHLVVRDIDGYDCPTGYLDLKKRPDPPPPGNFIGCRLVGLHNQGFQVKQLVSIPPEYLFIVGEPSEMIIYNTQRTKEFDKPAVNLYRCEPFNPFTPDELLAGKAAADSSQNLLPLTEAEQAQSEQAQAANVIAAREKAKSDQERMIRENAAADQQEIENKTRRSQSYLDSGKVLLKKENYMGARKQFQKAVTEAPDSEPGKEAAELLDTTPAIP